MDFDHFAYLQIADENAARACQYCGDPDCLCGLFSLDEQKLEVFRQQFPNWTKGHYPG